MLYGTTQCLTDLQHRMGVKQGGVLSPLLFAVYIDELLRKLQPSGMVVLLVISNYDAFGYADDISLATPTIYGLKEMYAICHLFTSYSSAHFRRSMERKHAADICEDLVTTVQRTCICQ